PSIPAAAELAAPIVAGLYELWNALGREDRVGLLVERFERAEFDESLDVETARADLAEYVDRVEEIARLIRATVSMLTVEPSAAVSGGFDVALRAIAQADTAEQALSREAVDAIRF